MFQTNNHTHCTYNFLRANATLIRKLSYACTKPWSTQTELSNGPTIPIVLISKTYMFPNCQMIPSSYSQEAAGDTAKTLTI